ncbi:MAG: hypothetical protein MUE81_17430 [Thermoflexibacter sp.]|jgi:hypothetical protein|nr:hypothetical protein [Thermoflexibacter sp.]
MQTIPVTKFTNLQMEILKLFAVSLSEDDLQVIKTLIITYLSQRAIHLATQEWEKRDLDEDELLNMHLRTPYQV